MALNAPRVLLLKQLGYKDTIPYGMLGAMFPGHRQKQLTQTFFKPAPNCEKSTELQLS